MRIGVTAILLATCLGACRWSDYRPSPQGRGEAQIVALSVRTEPPGAMVRVNQLARSWTTPCNIADYALQKGPIDLELTLEGRPPIRTQVMYDGVTPVDVRLVFEGTVAAAPTPVPPPVPAPAPAPAPIPREDPALRPPVVIETTSAGTWLKVTSKDAKISLKAKMVVTDPDKPGQFFLPNVPPEKVVVEFLDPKTDAVLNSVEFAPSQASAPPPTPAPVPAPAVKDYSPTGVDRVGEVKVVSKTYGVFVKLDPGLSLQPGEEILVFRGGKEVARTKILKITKGDPLYPDGAAQVQKDGPIQKGDEVRRPKP